MDHRSHHALQFKTTQLRIVPPTTLEGIDRYLGSGMVKGIGPHFARKLVQALPGASGLCDIAHGPPPTRREAYG